jgi:hypothetical protein
LAGRNLLRAYRWFKPKGRLPLAMWVSISARLVLLIAGVFLEFR